MRRNISLRVEWDYLTLTHSHRLFVPWQQLATEKAEKGARIRVIPVDDTGQVILPEYNA